MTDGWIWAPAEPTVRITIYDIPESLVKEFAQRIVKSYPRGISEAIEDLMRKAV